MKCLFQFHGCNAVVLFTSDKMPVTSVVQCYGKIWHIFVIQCVQRPFYLTFFTTTFFISFQRRKLPLLHELSVFTELRVLLASRQLQYDVRRRHQMLVSFTVNPVITRKNQRFPPRGEPTLRGSICRENFWKLHELQKKKVTRAGEGGGLASATDSNTPKDKGLR